VISVLVVSALAYSMLALLEIRLSPFLHPMIYGYAQHSFLQFVRASGYRPVVFMAHPLAVASFFAVAMLGAVCLWRVRQRVLGLPAGPVAVFLALVLLLCKGAASIVYAVVAVPGVATLRPRALGWMAALLALLVLAYPGLRIAGLFPTGAAVDLARVLGEERAGSLRVRFDNEDSLIQKALERPLLGWGGFGRGRVYDVKTGRDLTISDGYWVIRLGSFGLVGLAATFGLLLAPSLLLARRIRRIPDTRDAMLSAGLSLLVAVGGLDLLPNGFLNEFQVFLSGAIAGICDCAVRSVAVQPRAAIESASPNSAGLAEAVGG
jgi:hypothetical protein